MFSKGKRQTIRFEQNLCHAQIDDNEILFVRVNDVVTSADARIEVPVTHNAIVIKGGGDLRYYTEGTYDVFEDRSEIKKWKKGLSVEVIYIPKNTFVLIKWGTPNRLRYRDEASNKVITVGARGEFTVSVVNPEQFFRKVVGAKKEFNLTEFKKRYAETVATEFTDIFLRTIEEKHLTYDRFAANKKAIGVSIGEELNVMFENNWGLSVSDFKIADFDLHEEDMASIEDAAAEKQKQERLKEYLAEVERLDDKNWEREKYLRQLELQDKNAYYEVLKIIGSHEPQEKKEHKCPNCGLECKPTAKFCPHCGKRLSQEPILCPDCGASNEYFALFCSNCGKKLQKGE